ncbi:MAG: hypothetical protein AAF311_12790 [Pseudomonadota bacterium]
MPTLLKPSLLALVMALGTVSISSAQVTLPDRSSPVTSRMSSDLPLRQARLAFTTPETVIHLDACVVRNKSGYDIGEALRKSLQIFSRMPGTDHRLHAVWLNNGQIDRVFESDLFEAEPRRFFPGDMLFPGDMYFGEDGQVSAVEPTAVIDLPDGIPETDTVATLMRSVARDANALNGRAIVMFVSSDAKNGRAIGQVVKFRNQTTRLPRLKR